MTKKKTDKYQAVPQRGPRPLPSKTSKAVVLNLSSHPTSGSWGSGVASQEGFVENSILIKFTSFYLVAKALSNQHMYGFFDLTSNIRNLIFLLIPGNVI